MGVPPPPPPPPAGFPSAYSTPNFTNQNMNSNNNVTNAHTSSTLPTPSPPPPPPPPPYSYAAAAAGYHQFYGAQHHNTYSPSIATPLSSWTGYAPPSTLSTSASHSVATKGWAEVASSPAITSTNPSLQQWGSSNTLSSSSSMTTKPAAPAANTAG
jgi:hypothetical protein